MLSIKKVRKAAAARAQAMKSQKKIVLDLKLTFLDSAVKNGGVNYIPSDTDTDNE